MTPEEKHLWYDFLSGYPVRFQRQKTVGNYIVDFYCHRAKLVVELDGGQHNSDEGMKYDETRTNYLNSCGLHVIRFFNIDVDNNFCGVCEVIDRTIMENETINGYKSACCE